MHRLVRRIRDFGFAIWVSRLWALWEDYKHSIKMTRFHEAVDQDGIGWNRGFLGGKFDMIDALQDGGLRFTCTFLLLPSSIYLDQVEIRLRRRSALFGLILAAVVVIYIDCCCMQTHPSPRLDPCVSCE